MITQVVQYHLGPSAQYCQLSCDCPGPSPVLYEYTNVCMVQHSSVTHDSEQQTVDIPGKDIGIGHRFNTAPGIIINFRVVVVDKGSDREVEERHTEGETSQQRSRSFRPTVSSVGQRDLRIEEVHRRYLELGEEHGSALDLAVSGEFEKLAAKGVSSSDGHQRLAESATDRRIPKNDLGIRTVRRTVRPPYV